MIYTTQVPHLEKEVRSSVTLGKFDGLHRGHQKLINLIRREQGEKNRSVIFTFDVSPRSYILHSPPKYLLTYEERRELAENLGVDILAECPFTEALMHMEPEDFVKEYLAERLHARYLAVGPDFRFGYQRRGTPELLKELGRTYGFRTEIVEKEKYKGRDISSTFVREELEKGHIEEVNQLLGYTYFTKGEIVHGRQLGRTIGIPTANLIPPVIKKLPPNGVYITESLIQGKTYQGITNIGYKPTVKENFLGVETYLFSCNADLYGQEAEVRFYRYLRPEIKFSSLEELKCQMLKDIEEGKSYFRLKK
ncbi:MAG TPA: bifunctional riboflavin kinase/FAD synthetase [Candidatus Blautia merdipullorum]|nr:bifunctional riboflavin kinase/FAD synthetase [Candidatus Blautia merdipullorum]